MITTIIILGILVTGLGIGCYQLNSKLIVHKSEFDAYEHEVLELEHKLFTLLGTINSLEARRLIELEAYETTVTNLRAGFDSEKFETEPEVISKPKRKPRK